MVSHLMQHNYAHGSINLPLHSIRETIFFYYYFQNGPTGSSGLPLFKYGRMYQ